MLVFQHATADQGIGSENFLTFVSLSGKFESEKKTEQAMNILAVIPARGGSKSIPRKNIVIVNGCPLIEYTISAAMKVDGLTDVVVSTDDSEIAEISKALGAYVPFLRPAELASDMSQSAPVVAHAMNAMEKIRIIANRYWGIAERVSKGINTY